MKKRILFYLLFCCFLFPFTINDFVFSNINGESIELTDIQDDELLVIDDQIISEACDMPINHISLKQSHVLYNSSDNIGGFQFSIKNGEILNIEGGDAGKSDFIMTNSQTVVLGFNLTGNFIPKGCGVLANIGYKGFNVDIEDLTVSNELGENLYFDTYTNAIDVNNVVSSKTKDLIDIDITEIVFSAKAGLPIGINYVCHKDECLDHTYHIEPENPMGYVTLYLENISKNIWAMKYSSDIDIAGYQFNVEGGKIKSAFGGQSELNGFTTQAKNKTILSFSFKGDVIESREGTLIKFEIQ